MAKDVFTIDGMTVDDFTFFIGEGPGFGEDGIGDMDLADVMENGGIAELMGLVRREAEFASEQLGVALNAENMLAGIAVFGFAGDGKHLQGVHVRHAKFSGAFTDPFLKHGVDAF